MRNENAVKPRLLSTESAAAYLGISPRALRSKHYTGEIRAIFPFFPSRKIMMFDIIDLDGWIDRQKGLSA